MKIKVGEEYVTNDGKKATVVNNSTLYPHIFRVQVSYNGCYLYFNYTEDGLYDSKEDVPTYPLHLKEKEQKEPFVFPEGTNRWLAVDCDGWLNANSSKKRELVVDYYKDSYPPYIVYKAVGYVDVDGEYHKLKKEK